MLEALERVGFAVIRNQPEECLLTFAEELGRPVPEPRDGILVKSIRPVAPNGAVKKTLSERYGVGEFPLHTEAAYWRAPPRYLLLYCRHPSRANRGTVLVDAEPLFRMSDAQSLRLDPWVVNVGLKSFLCTVVAASGRHNRLRYDGECMRPTTYNGTAQAVLQSFIRGAEPVVQHWKPGALLVIDNHRMLHGRLAAEVPDPDRELLKILVHS